MSRPLRPGPPRLHKEGAPFTEGSSVCGALDWRASSRWPTFPGPPLFVFYPISGILSSSERFSGRWVDPDFSGASGPKPGHASEPGRPSLLGSPPQVRNASKSFQGRHPRARSAPRCVPGRHLNRLRGCVPAWIRLRPSRVGCSPTGKSGLGFCGAMLALTGRAGRLEFVSDDDPRSRSWLVRQDLARPEAILDRRPVCPVEHSLRRMMARAFHKRRKA